MKRLLHIYLKLLSGLEKTLWETLYLHSRVERNMAVLFIFFNFNDIM